MASPSPRAVAVQILSLVLDEKRAFDAQLSRHGPFLRLSRRDRAFVHRLVATALRRLGQLDDALGNFVAKPPSSRPVRHVLRLGACQLMFLGTPAHAAVSTSLALLDELRLASLKGLANAVLRRLAEAAPNLVAGQDAARLNTPDRLWRSWETAYGAETCRGIAEAHLAEPPLDLSVRGDPTALATLVGGRMLPSGTVRLTPSGPVNEIAGYAEGRWWVQDAAAALPVRLLGDVAGRRVIDLCAAPGGKTAQLAAAGAQVAAVDRAAPRLRLVRDNLDRLGLAAELVLADATAWQPGEPADLVLLDAPCSATGTIRRNPDIPWTQDESRVPVLAALQEQLLGRAITMVKPGGRIVYCVCSLEDEESRRVVERVLESHGNARPCDPPADAVLEPYLDPRRAPFGCLRTLPSMQREEGGMDGFFAAVLERV